MKVAANWDEPEYDKASVTLFIGRMPSQELLKHVEEEEPFKRKAGFRRVGHLNDKRETYREHGAAELQDVNQACGSSGATLAFFGWSEDVRRQSLIKNEGKDGFQDGYVMGWAISKTRAAVPVQWTSLKTVQTKTRD